MEPGLPVRRPGFFSA